MVLELKPSGQDKGSAVRRFMEEPPFAGRTPVFIGDDVTDEDGFAAAHSLGGMSIRVGREGPSCAMFRIADVEGFLEWFESGLLDGVPVDEESVNVES